EKTGRVVASTDPTQFPGSTDLSRHPLIAQARLHQSTAFQQGFTDEKRHSMQGAFQSVGFAGLSVLAQVSSTRLLAIRNELYRRSFFLAGGILCLALLVSFALSRGISGPITRLSQAANKISEGDFSVRVKTDHRTFLETIETSILSKSFNEMAERIGILIVETEKKARLEKEIETAQIVQQRFFPNREFKGKGFDLTGQILPASECGGDWWQYHQEKNHLFVAIGDVTGHGVSAALVTAAAHALFVTHTRRLQQFSESRDDLRRWFSDFARELNWGILAAGGGKASMTFVISAIDLVSGMIVSLNAGHRPPYVFRKKNQPESISDFFIPLTAIGASTLGERDRFSFSLVEFQSLPGDLFFWYTDGIMECEDQNGKTIRKMEILKILASLSESHSDKPEALCRQFMAT
ncbi:MAG: SpoIIE family protein phosphatase, partial [Bdellovibrionota bacterium]